MINFLKQLFALPSFNDDIQTYTARMLRVTLASIAVLALAYVVLNLASDPANAGRYGLQAFFIFLTLAGMLALSHLGQPRAASIVLVISTWAIFTFAAFTGGGLRSSAYIGYLVVLVIVSLVAAHPGWTLAITALCAASGYALLYAEQNGFLPAAQVSNSSMRIWIDSLVYFGLVATLQIIAARIVLDALRRAQAESQSRLLDQEKERARAILFQRVIELGKEVTQANELDWCLKKIHHSIQNGLGFDRVGLFLYDKNSKSIQGTYGTDLQGMIENTSWFVQSVEENDAWQIALQSPEGMEFVSNYSHKHASLKPESEMYGVKEHITLAAWAGKEPVALIAVDNALSNRPIEAGQVEALRLFAGYAGLAIVNARNLQAINQELESFSYSVSHDLRSPLRAVVGFSQILLTEFDPEEDETRHSYLRKIHENGKKMGVLIDDLLNFSRVGRQKMQIVNCDTKIIVEGIIERLREKFPDQKTRWIVQDLPACKADYVLLQQVWLRLLENAQQYSQKHPEPTIEAGSLQTDNQTIFFVRDNGEGFDMKYTDKIFRIFHRLQHDDEAEGTGVGLAIVQRAVQRHGGKLWAESQPGKGATFYFTLP